MCCARNFFFWKIEFLHLAGKGCFLFRKHFCFDSSSFLYVDNPLCSVRKGKKSKFPLFGEENEEENDLVCTFVSLKPKMWAALFLRTNRTVLPPVKHSDTFPYPLLPSTGPKLRRSCGRKGGGGERLLKNELLPG